MIIHITPSFLACSQSGSNCELVELVLPEFGLTLKGGVDIVTRRPYPNKRYQVACRKKGQTAVIGIFIETKERVSEFTSIARWSIGAERIATHEVNYIILDNEHDAASDDMARWYSWSHEGQMFEVRWPEVSKHWSPASARPRAQLTQLPKRNGLIADSIVDGVITRRVETFHMHTLERERVLASRSWAKCVPTLDSAFVANC
ncbi:hypothetical protein HMPREF1487_09388 [Pseudomonas sp. HPB0071]|uniref:DUF6012 family protein n=1 Tax=unclassified Pseudomonas TaxID=196821 RepID=UPI0002C94572|nr:MULTISPECIES: DUF6012 family protein [unclassified Pseudomonas]ENA27175.1 hypothetical protein HMPREF1487_09388 [Pseudomonas sp. HPB0071]